MSDFFILSSFLLASVWAGPKEHRHHSAHEHGTIKVQIAFDGAQGQMQISGAALPFLGFESESDEVKKKSAIEVSKKKLEGRLPKMIVFVDDAKCLFVKNSISFIFEKSTHKKDKKAHSGEHADIQVESQIRCEKMIKNTIVKFDFSAYPELKDIDIDFLIDSNAKNVEVKGGKAEIQLE